MLDRQQGLEAVGTPHQRGQAPATLGMAAAMARGQ